MEPLPIRALQAHMFGRLRLRLIRPTCLGDKDRVDALVKQNLLLVQENVRLTRRVTIKSTLANFRRGAGLQD